jgi:hypothetical protein
MTLLAFGLLLCGVKRGLVGSKILVLPFFAELLSFWGRFNSHVRKEKELRLAGALALILSASEQVKRPAGDGQHGTPSCVGSSSIGPSDSWSARCSNKRYMAVVSFTSLFCSDWRMLL